MQIRLPPAPRWAIRAVHLVNRPVVSRVRWIDVILIVMGAGVGAYYWHVGGPLLAAGGVALYSFIAMMALWL